MFHSKHPAAMLHATARVVSGSGVYVSDKPGAHDFELLRRMVLPDGSVMRPLLPGRPTKDILFADVLKDNKTLLKVPGLLFWGDYLSLLRDVYTAASLTHGKLANGVGQRDVGSTMSFLQIMS